MNLLIALLLILGVGFYLRFVVAMVREIMRQRPHTGWDRSLGHTRPELRQSRFESSRTLEQSSSQLFGHRPLDPRKPKVQRRAG
jgi:hypothetical protein